MKKIIDKTGGLTNICPPRIVYTFHSAGKTVNQIIDEINVREKSTRTFQKSEIQKALQKFDLNCSLLKNRDTFKILFLARHVAGHSHVLVQISYTRENSTFTIDGVKYNDEVLPDVFVAYAFD
jgi:hypothetical protein